MHADIDALVRAVEEVVGLSLAPPDIDGGLFKIPGSAGLFHDRDLYAQFAAWHMRDRRSARHDLRDRRRRRTRCVLGPAFGLGSYPIIDLPHINVLQGYYLLTSLPQTLVHLSASPRAQVFSVRPYFAKS